MTEPNAVSVMGALGYVIHAARKVGQEYNAETGGYSTSRIKEFQFRGAIKAYKTKEINETSVLATDAKLLIDAFSSDYVPEIGDIIEGKVKLINDEEQIEGGRKILTFRPVRPSGRTVAYICQVR